MKICIQNLITGQELNITDLVIDTLELGDEGYTMLASEENYALIAEAIDIAACYAESRFGHDNVDAYIKN
jgi:RecB family endonuclease NucS